MEENIDDHIITNGKNSSSFGFEHVSPNGSLSLTKMNSIKKNYSNLYIEIERKWWKFVNKP